MFGSERCSNLNAKRIRATESTAVPLRFPQILDMLRGGNFRDIYTNVCVLGTELI